MIISNNDLELYQLFAESILKVMASIIEKEAQNSGMYQTEYLYRCGMHDMRNKIIDNFNLKLEAK